jgi:dTDP-4-amino-4,6-dideoxygalactose transaminase
MKIRNIAVPVEADAVPVEDCYITEEAQAAALRVLRSGWVTTGREALGFEAEFAAGVGARQTVAVSSSTAAIELALRSLGSGAGRRRLRDRHADAGRRARGRSGLRYAGRDDRRALGRRPSGRARARRCDVLQFLCHQDLPLGEGGMATTDDPERADALFEQLLSLPIYPRLTDDQVDAVCTAIADTACRQFSRKGAE